MNTQELTPAILLFYAYALALGVFLLCRDVPLQDATTQATSIAMLAWLLINRRWQAGD
jgi:hypothetical protein